MRERAVLLRTSPALVGVMTEPAVAADTPAVILINAGIVHRVGPNRLYVQIARRMAAAGWPVLRFDLSGLGDSEPRADALSHTESAPMETREAMDFVARTTGANRFVLLGICSGAATAMRVACDDPRVVGAVLIEPDAYPTPAFHRRYYLRRLKQWSSWKNTLSGRNRLGQRLVGGLRELATSPAMIAEDSGDTPLIPREATAAAFRALLDRDVKLCVVFSGVPSNYNYRGQLQDAFPELPLSERVTVEFFAEADHTFGRQYWQDRLIESVARWANTAFAASRASVACWLGCLTIFPGV